MLDVHKWKKNTQCCGIFLYMLYVATKLDKTWILKLLPKFYKEKEGKERNLYIVAPLCLV